MLHRRRRLPRIFARGLSPRELADRLAAALGHDRRHTAVPAGDHTGASFQELLDDDDIGLRLGSAGEWAFAVAYGPWQGAHWRLPPVSRDGAHACLLEYEEENGKPVPPQFVALHDGRLLAHFNLHLDGSWGYEKVEGDDPATTAALQERLTAAGLPDPERVRNDVHRAALGVVGEYFGLSLPREAIVHGTLPAVVLEPA